MTISQFDALKRLVQKQRSGLLLETHEYDGKGNKTAFVDGQRNRTEYSYDTADRLIAATDGAGSPVAAITRTTYDNVGNVLTVKDARNHGGAFARLRVEKGARLLAEQDDFAGAGIEARPEQAPAPAKRLLRRIGVLFDDHRHA